jgi:hypothetical protein
VTTARTVRTVEKGDWKVVFLRELARVGIVGAACKKARVGRTTAYKTRDEDAEFAAAWAAALDDAADDMETEAWRRGKAGVLKPVYQVGKDQDGQIGVVRKYSDALLTTLAKAAKPEKYRDRQQIDVTASLYKVYQTGDGFDPDAA